MEKTNGYYMAKYLKNNVVVLICELVIVLLLSVICTVILEGDPVWLAPVLALVAYLMAEVRFMMAYIATNARQDHEIEQLRAKTTEVAEPTAQEEPEVASFRDEDDAQDDVMVSAMAAAFASSSVAESTEKANTPDLSDDLSDDDAFENEVFGDAAFDEDEALPEEDIWQSAQLDMDAVADEDLLDSDDGHEQETLESIEMALPEEDDDALDDMTMQDGDFDKDVLDIGEIG